MLRLSMLPLGLSAALSVMTSPSAHANPYGYQQQRYQAATYDQPLNYPAQPQPRYIPQPRYDSRRPVQHFVQYQQPYYQPVGYQADYQTETTPPAHYAPQPSRLLPFQQSAQYAPPITERIIIQAPQKQALPPVRRAILDRAHQVLGVKYKYGGNSVREGLDCSALIQLTHKPIGRSIPRTAAEQSRASRTILRQELRPGDLIFFNTLGRGVSHVGIYVKNGSFIHAASGGGRVMVDNLSKSYWQKRIVKYGTFVG